jgi:hypothetical protein
VAASITFDFLSRGAGQLQGDIRKVGDNTALAAKGAKVLSDAIEQLGKKEDRTAAESATLAKALRLTGDAEDRVAAKAVLADAAVRRLDDAMKDAAKKPLVPEVISAKALAKLTEIKVRAEELKARFPEFTLRIDDRAAKLKLAALAVEAKAVDDAINSGFGNAGGGNRSLLSRVGGLFSGGGGSGGGAAGGAGGLTSPAGLGALGIGGALLAALTPAIAGLGIGGAVGGGAIAGGLFGAAEGKKTLNADLSTIKTLTTKLKTAIGQQKAEISAALKDAEKQYEKDAAFFAPFTAFQSSLQGLAKTLLAPLRTVMAPLTQIFTQFGKGLTALGPQLAAMFKASLPFVDMFLKLLLTAGKTLIPAFTGAMQQMVKSGALTQMSQGLVIIVNGLAGFITALGPGMAASATIFKGIAVIIAAVLRGLGLAFAYMANTFADNMHHIRLIIKDFPGWFDTARHEVAHIWDVMFQDLIGTQIRFGHNVEHAWDTLMSDIASVFNIAKEGIRITWDKIKLLFLQGEDFIVRTMGKLPGPLGAPFRAAHASIQQSMAAIQRDVATATGNMQASIDRLHGKNVPISVTGSGHGGVVITTSGLAAAGQGNVRFTSGNAAQGLYISRGTGPTADDVMIRASKGELVVPANMVKAGAVDHLRGAIPGFASGGFLGVESALGRVAGVAAGVEGRGAATAMAAGVKAAVAKAKAAMAKAGSVGNYKPGAGVAQWAPVISRALAMLGLSPGLLGAVEAQMASESGGNPYAVNKWDSNWLAGHPSVGLMQVIRGTFQAYAGPYRNTGPFAYGVSENPLANIYAALNYGKHGAGFGTGPGQIGSMHGYASGGQVGTQGAAWLKAWQSRHGGGFGAAWGPASVNQQIPEMAAAVQRAKALSGASGLSPGQHRFWAATAADETKRLGVLGRELATERAWRTQLGLNELGLDKQIRAAGNLPSLAGPVRGWKAQLGRDKARVAAISKMLGYSDAFIAAHPAPKPGPVLPTITHTYGGDVANNLGTVLAAALGPFTGARAGGLVMDQGGTLRPGFNPVWNMTGRPESLVPARGGGGVHLHLTVNGPVGSPQQLEDWFVRTANKTAQHGRLSQAVRAAGR